jgi:DNA-binding MarR family transcriptional regulator
MAKGFYRTDAFESRRALGYLIRKTHNTMLPHAEALFADADISFSQWVALMAVRDGVATTCGEIARHLGHDTGATTRLVDQLAERGLVERQRSTNDRRVIHLRITPAGKAMVKSLAQRLVEFWNTILEGFSNDESSLLISLMTRLLARLEAQPMAGTAP